MIRISLSLSKISLLLLNEKYKTTNMKKLSILLLASVLTLTATTVSANCGKKDCKDCKKEAKAHKCTKECMKDGKCAEMKKKK